MKKARTLALTLGAVVIAGCTASDADWPGLVTAAAPDPEAALVEYYEASINRDF